eukprot:gene15282-18081_t
MLLYGEFVNSKYSIQLMILTGKYADRFGSLQTRFLGIDRALAKTATIQVYQLEFQAVVLDGLYKTKEIIDLKLMPSEAVVETVPDLERSAPANASSKERLQEAEAGSQHQIAASSHSGQATLHDRLPPAKRSDSSQVPSDLPSSRRSLNGAAPSLSPPTCPMNVLANSQRWFGYVMTNMPSIMQSTGSHSEGMLSSFLGNSSRYPEDTSSGLVLINDTDAVAGGSLLSQAFLVEDVARIVLYQDVHTCFLSVLRGRALEVTGRCMGRCNWTTGDPAPYAVLAVMPMAHLTLDSILLSPTMFGKGRLLVLSLKASLTLINCILTSTSTLAWAGGVGVHDGGAVAISSTVFSFLHSSEHGGAVRVTDTETFVMTDSVVANCSADISAGGILAYGVHAVTITNSSFIGNTAVESSGALEILSVGDLILAKSLFIKNRAEMEAGALRLQTGDPGYLRQDSMEQLQGEFTNLDLVNDREPAGGNRPRSVGIAQCMFQENWARKK